MNRLSLRDRLNNVIGQRAVDTTASEPLSTEATLDDAQIREMFGEAYTRHVDVEASVAAEEVPEVSDNWAEQLTPEAIDSLAEQAVNATATELESVEVEPVPVEDEPSQEPEPELTPENGFIERGVEDGSNRYVPAPGIPTPHMNIPDSILSATTSGRFSGAEWYEAVKNARVTVIGCGGIGSYTAFLISRFNPHQIVLYDDDMVNLVNMAGQFFALSDIGEFKTDAVANRLRDFSNYYNVFSIVERFTEYSGITNIVISCLDNMEGRRLAFNRWKNTALSATKEDRSKYLFIDGRLAAEEFQVFSVAGDNQRGMLRYEASLFSDAEADHEACSYKQTSFMANMIASVIANVFINHIAYTENHNMIREIPFKVEYSANAMYFKTEM